MLQLVRERGGPIVIINGNKTGWNKGDKVKKLKHFTVPKCHVPNTSDRFLLSCNIMYINCLTRINAVQFGSSVPPKRWYLSTE